jgi:hypothetical protein
VGRSEAVNKRRLRIIAAQLKKEPKSYNQNQFCGTACCIAGHAVQRWGTTREKHIMKLAAETEQYGVDTDIFTDAVDFEGRGAELLGLDAETANKLFSSTYDWPSRYKTPSGRVTPATAAKRLRDMADGRAL